MKLKTQLLVQIGATTFCATTIDITTLSVTIKMPLSVKRCQNDTSFTVIKLSLIFFVAMLSALMLSVIMQSVIILSVIMLNNVILRVNMLSNVMQIYMQRGVIMLCASMSSAIHLRVVKLSVIVPEVTAPFKWLHKIE